MAYFNMGTGHQALTVETSRYDLEPSGSLARPIIHIRSDETRYAYLAVSPQEAIRLVNDLLVTLAQLPPRFVSGSIPVDEARERVAQDAQWGGPEHDDQHRPQDWAHFLIDHASRLGTWAADGNFASADDYRHRLVKVAALAQAAIAAHDRAAARAAEEAALQQALDSPDVLAIGVDDDGAMVALGEDGEERRITGGRA